MVADGNNVIIFIKFVYILGVNTLQSSWDNEGTMDTNVEKLRDKSEKGWPFMYRISSV